MPGSLSTSWGCTHLCWFNIIPTQNPIVNKCFKMIVSYLNPSPRSFIETSELNLFSREEQSQPSFLHPHPILLVSCVYNWFDDILPRWPSGLAGWRSGDMSSGWQHTLFYFISAMEEGKGAELELKPWLTLLLHDCECVRESSLLCSFRDGVNRTYSSLEGWQSRQLAFRSK